MAGDEKKKTEAEQTPTEQMKEEVKEDMEVREELDPAYNIYVAKQQKQAEEAQANTVANAEKEDYQKTHSVQADIAPDQPAPDSDAKTMYNYYLNKALQYKAVDAGYVDPSEINPVKKSMADRMRSYNNELEGIEGELNRMAKLSNLTQPIPIGSKVTEMRGAMKGIPEPKAGDMKAPVAPEMYTTDPTWNQAIITTALSILGGFSAGEVPGAAGPAMVGTMAKGVEGVNELNKQKLEWNKALYTVYADSLKSFNTNIKDIWNKYMEESGKNERKIMEQAVKQINDEYARDLNDRKLQLEAKKAERESVAGRQTAESKYFENMIKAIDVKLKTLQFNAREKRLAAQQDTAMIISLGNFFKEKAAKDDEEIKTLGDALLEQPDELNTINKALYYEQHAPITWNASQTKAAKNKSDNDALINYFGGTPAALMQKMMDEASTTGEDFGDIKAKYLKQIRNAKRNLAGEIKFNRMATHYEDYLEGPTGQMKKRKVARYMMGGKDPKKYAETENIFNIVDGKFDTRDKASQYELLQMGMVTVAPDDLAEVDATAINKNNLYNYQRLSNLEKVIGEAISKQQAAKINKQGKMSDAEKSRDAFIRKMMEQEGRESTWTDPSEEDIKKYGQMYDAYYGAK